MDDIIDPDEFTEEYANALLRLHDRYVKRTDDYVLARNRNVYLFKDYVVKIPRNINGYADNDWEGSISNADDDPEMIRYARTRMVYYHDIPIVFMERLTHADNEEIEERLGHVPDWIWSVDCAQVGFNKHGKLLAYDYGLR